MGVVERGGHEGTQNVLGATQPSRKPQEVEDPQPR